jgi:hypothetical protein
LIAIIGIPSISAFNSNGLIFELKNTNNHRTERKLDPSFDMRNFNRMQYFIEIPVGSEKQLMQFLIDTGSSVSGQFSSLFLTSFTVLGSMDGIFRM